MDVLTLNPVAAGLNNQRYALLGLFEIARARGAAVRLPTQVVDFTPQAGSNRHVLMPIWDAFDRGGFLRAILGSKTTKKAVSETLDAKAAFDVGAHAIHNAQRGDFAEAFIGEGVRAAAPLRATADEAAAFLAEKRAATLQLRIERDWQVYLRKRLGAVEARTAQGHVTVDPLTILRKVRATPALARFEAVFACCDEDDLAVSKEAIKEAGAVAGVEVLLKPDLPVAYPASRLKRSLIDFEICRAAPAYVGLAASTFSRSLRYLARAEGRLATQFRYDAGIDQCAPFAEHVDAQ
ncbi:MAG: hypothetical protein AB7J28_14105 [Hyphomonadaceae bacterium]